jgi:hypothetical protein
MKAVDSDGNGHITYNGQLYRLPFAIRLAIANICLAEFRTFVHETERELLALFKSIDYNNDGKLSKPELRAALSRAGLAVPNSSLDNFFTEVDSNNDGTISFEEWRYVHQLSWLALLQSTVAILAEHINLVVGESSVRALFAHSKSCCTRTCDP